MIDREQWAKEFSERGRDSGSILDTVRITPPTPPLKNLCSPGWTYSPDNKTLHRMNCKRRTCEDCGWFWAWRWRKALQEKARNDFELYKKRADKALTLTFAENVPFRIMQRILEWFWETMRRAYPGIEYWGAVEFNQNHTIPHLHFILADCPYVELDYIDYAWRAAQKRAKLAHLAWNLRIEKIRSNAAAYFTKYVTKLLGGKDEIPRRENWQGRFVRYSRGFFPVPITAMLAGKKFNDKLAANDALDRVYWHVRKPLAGVSGFMERSDKDNAFLNALTAQPWQPLADIGRAAALPPPDLLTGIETIPVSFIHNFDKEFYQGLEGYNYSTKTGRYGPTF